MEQFGIDISRWQGDFNIKAAMNESVKFAIIKCGGGDNVLYKDSQYENNYIKCKSNNLDTGCYFFGHALTIADAVKEAEYWLTLMSGHRFELPVFYDVEADMLKLDKRTLTDIIKTVCQIIEDAGYWVGIYASSSTFNNRVYDEELKDFTHWVASWTSTKPRLNSKNVVQVWQFGGEVNKIGSNKINNQVVDQNYSYVDFPSIIKEKHLNNYRDDLKSCDEIASEVLEGLWGNGPERKQRLINAGYDYFAIQSLVNQKVGEKNGTNNI